MVDGDQQTGREDDADAIDSPHPGVIPWTRK
jgi:hypothetical protein